MMKINKKGICVAIAILFTMYIGKIVFSQSDVAPPSHVSMILKRDVENISLKEAKKVFNTAFDDRSGQKKVIPGLHIYIEDMAKLENVFARTKSDESLFYLGRMKCITVYLGPSLFKGVDQKRAHFHSGYEILEHLAERGYKPAQLYMGAITLSPNNMFGHHHLSAIKYPRYNAGPDGMTHTCMRRHYIKEDIEEWNLKNVQQEIYPTETNLEKFNMDIPKELRDLPQKLGDAFTSVQNTYFINISPRSNGYGPSYGQAIQWLEEVGEAGNGEAWQILDNYFSFLVTCHNIADGSLPLVKWKHQYYKNKNN